ncbi:hypothetical protein [Streptomyces sp. NBC_01565]|uniref:hypothetical protein n=1 Tax=unclassified Streptomyces TaxID=2593676 RepID=UPI0022531761|nr:hypothetical protein [Streptomyces sp. NBC_01565]MCX4545943.1 hypothetical protein [Streptomyces sp. NBC_01565]
MTSELARRIHLMITFVLVACAAVGGGCLGLLWGGWITSLVAAAAAGLGAGIGSFLARRQVVAFLQPDAVRVDGYAEGIADAVLVSIATYQAAAFPLTPDGVSDEERAARRTVAYRSAAYDGLPLPVRLSAAAALEAIDAGGDTESAHVAMKELSLTVYEQRGGR